MQANSRVMISDLLKSLTPCHRVCPNCDMYIKEDLFHVVMQCPIHEPLRRNMCNTLYQIDDRIERIFADVEN